MVYRKILLSYVIIPSIEKIVMGFPIVVMLIERLTLTMFSMQVRYVDLPSIAIEIRYRIKLLIQASYFPPLIIKCQK